MIVNPQLFNYKLTTSSLVILVVILSSLSYHNYITIKNQEKLFKQENHLVQNELSIMIDNYQRVNAENDRIKLKLKKTETHFNKFVDSVKILPKNETLIAQYEPKIKTAHENEAMTLSLLMDYQNKNLSLQKELEVYANFTNVILNTSGVMISKIPEETLSTIGFSGLIKNQNLIPKSLISIKNIKVQGVKKITSNNKIITTKTAAKANLLQVSFILPKNEVVSSNKENLYIQILDANNNVVGDKGIISFGDRDLIYSAKAIVKHEYESLTISALIKTNKNEPLIKGAYLVNIFHDSARIANTVINLK